MNVKKTAICAAVTAAMGFGASSVSAQVLGLDFNGLFTLLNSSGTDVVVNGDSPLGPYYGRRTPVSGTMSFDTGTGAGSGTMVPFSFFGSGTATASGISFQAVGDGASGAGPLVLGNLGFSWNNTIGIPVSLVLDGGGFFGYIGSQGGTLTAGDIGTTLSGSGSLPASDAFLFNFGKFSYTLPIGASPMVTTTFDTTSIGSPGLGSNPSGTLPFTDDGIGGDAMVTPPFAGFNANFDITSITITSIPVPAAVWLFGSGLIGLVGVARRKKKA